MITQDLSLSDLVNLEDWQKIQHQFSEALEITLRTVGLGGELLTEVSRPNRLCSEIIPRMNGSSNICSCCALRGADSKAAGPTRLDSGVRCPFGLDISVVSIEAVKNRTVAYLVVGPVILKSRKSVSEYEKDAKSSGIGLDELMDSLIEINVFSYNKLSSLEALIKDMFSYMAQTGYHKKRLGEIAPEIMALDPIFSRYYEEKILRSLLNACTTALGADSGSVMTLDKKTDMLHIKVASKLSDDVVSGSNVKMGEGIAGLAAAKAEPIILPKDSYKAGISGKMKRSEIKSSLIIPFSKHSASDVYGVINLNIIRKNYDFSDRDIALVKELVHMAGIALIPIRQSINGPQPAKSQS